MSIGRGKLAVGPGAALLAGLLIVGQAAAAEKVNFQFGSLRAKPRDLGPQLRTLGPELGQYRNLDADPGSRTEAD
jgi:hypothetical protein